MRPLEVEVAKTARIETSRRLGCDERQGFDRSAALPVDACFDYCTRGRKSAPAEFTPVGALPG